MFPELSEIRVRRRRLGWTQKTLAERSGVSQSTIAKIEKRRLVPSYNVAKNIFEALTRGEMKENAQNDRVERIMTRDVITVSKDDRISEVAKIMRKYGISQIPVLFKNEIVGMVTERDVLDAYEQFGHSAGDVFVGTIMSPPPPIIRRDTRIRGVVELLKQYPAVIVADKGKIDGIVTKSDIVYLV